MSKNPLTPLQILNFYKVAEKLKSTLRHSWLSDQSRQESVAEQAGNSEKLDQAELKKRR